CWDTFGLKFGSDAFQICGVLRNFWTDGVWTISSGGPSICYVKQHQAAMSQLRKLFDMLNNCPVRRRSVKSHENSVVHGRFVSCCLYHPPLMTRHAALSESGRP